jgi:hypothetical protein
MYDEDDEVETLPNAYSYAVALLDQGVMPVCIPIGDELHVLACRPTDRESLAQMINPDGDTRDAFMVQACVSLKTAIEEGQL